MSDTAEVGVGLSPERVRYFVENFDYHDAELWTDEHAVYQAMRSTCPVAYSPKHGGHWVISKYEHAHAAFQDPSTFSSAVIAVPNNIGQQRPLIPIQLDPPDHTRYRRLLSPAFSPKQMAEMEPVMRATCRQLLATFAHEPEIEFVDRFAKPYPTSIFLSLLGLPQDQADQFVAWTNRIIHGVADDPEGELRAEAGMHVYMSFAQLIDDRLTTPQDDLVSMLLHTELEGERLTDEEVLDICFLLFIAGLDTVTSALSLSFLYLGQAPGARRQLREHPELIPGAVEELVRYESPVSIARVATRDVDFHGCPIKAGEPVLIVTASANRDADEFADPDEVRFDRTANRHLGYGAGPHRCLGSHLARLELRVALEEFSRAFGDYWVTDLGAVRRHAGPVAGVDHLPLGLRR
jgi:cytochrome P450